MTFNPTEFILNNQDLFITVGSVVAIGALALCASAIALLLILKAER